MRRRTSADLGRAQDGIPERKIEDKNDRTPDIDKIGIEVDPLDTRSSKSTTTLDTNDTVGIMKWNCQGIREKRRNVRFSEPS